MQKLLVCKYSAVNLNPLWFTVENTVVVFFTRASRHADWRQRGLGSSSGEEFQTWN